MFRSHNSSKFTLAVAMLFLLLATPSIAAERGDRASKLNLSAEQKAEWSKIRESCSGRDECRQKFKAILTEEQKEKRAEHKRKSGKSKGQE